MPRTRRPGQDAETLAEEVPDQAGEAAAVPDDDHCNSRHSGWRDVMPRSRQISAMTAPIGRRRTSAAICSEVGR